MSKVKFFGQTVGFVWSVATSSTHSYSSRLQPSKVGSCKTLVLQMSKTFHPTRFA